MKEVLKSENGALCFTFQTETIFTSNAGKKQNNYEKCIAAQRENAYNFYEEAFPLFLQGRFYVLPSLALLHSDITYKKFPAFIEICMVWGWKE